VLCGSLSAGCIRVLIRFASGHVACDTLKDYHTRCGRYIWESGADGAFAISEDTDGEPLGRGTQINIYLKVGTQELASSLLPC